MRILLFVLALFTSLPSFSQISFSAADEAARKLREGVLIVRLYDKSDQIDYLMEKGHEQMAEKVRQETRLENKAIVDAFVNEYHVGAVYFMNAEDSRALADNEWNGILRDSWGETVNIEPLPYLVADISRSKNRGLNGLNIWYWEEDQWVHPPTPFPSHISAYGFLNLYHRTYSEMVELFNSRFIEE